MNHRKRIIVTLAVLIGAGLLVMALLPSPIPVSATRVTQEYFAEYIDDEGRTRLRDHYVVSAPIGGYLRRVDLEPGDSVDAGDVVFELEAMPAPALDARAREQAREGVAAARARLDAAQAELETHQAQREIAEAEFERVERLRERDLIAAEEHDRRRAMRDTAVAGERAARHGVDVARFELESARALLEVADGERARMDQPSLAVRAPIAGTITRRHRWAEGPIGAGEPIVEIGDLGDLEVQVDLLSIDAVRLAPGMRVMLERWGGPEALEGRVRRIEPGGFQRISALGVEEQRVPVLVQIVSPRDEWRALGDGYRVEARFVLWEGDDIVQVPTSALFRQDGRWNVFVASNGRAHLRPVTTGRRSGLQSQITAGLEPGEIVVTHPGDRIADGTRIDPDLR